MYSLHYKMNEQLPRLAWCARVESDGDVSVHHGPWVETGETAFYDGAWDGDFASSGFIESTLCMGTGARLEKDRIVFAAPGHTLESLYLVRAGGDVLVSNSLAFLLVEANDAPDPDYPLYQQDLVSIVDGLDRYVKKIPTRDGKFVELAYYCNIGVDSNLAVAYYPKAAPGEFRNYEDYVGYLRRGVTAIFDNAGDERRKRRYTPLTTLSSGYDSCAAAVLAREVGCKEAITFGQARGDFTELDDSGVRIGEKLSLKVTEFDRAAFRERPGCIEAEFVASGKGGQEVIMSVWDQLLPGRLLFTGFHGDRVWGIDRGTPSARIVRGDTSGGSLAEFRLRLGFIHLPVPFFGCVRHPEINAISKSTEMQPWSIVQTGRHRMGYNRPIPRRMVEERGVPREWFGQTKKAAGQPFGFYPREPNLSNLSIADSMSEDSLRDFEAFSASLNPALKGVAGFRFACLRLLYEGNARVLWRLRRYPRLSRLPQKWLLALWRYQNPLNRNSFLFHWGIGKISERYKTRP